MILNSSMFISQKGTIEVELEHCGDISIFGMEEMACRSYETLKEKKIVQLKVINYY